MLNRDFEAVRSKKEQKLEMMLLTPFVSSGTPFSVCRGRQTVARGGCNVHQSTYQFAPKIR